MRVDFVMIFRFADCDSKKFLGNGIKWFKLCFLRAALSPFLADFSGRRMLPDMSLNAVPCYIYKLLPRLSDSFTRDAPIPAGEKVEMCCCMAATTPCQEGDRGLLIMPTSNLPGYKLFCMSRSLLGSYALYEHQ